MKNSINRKAQQEEVQKSTCDRLNKRDSELSDRGEVQRKIAVRKFMRKVRSTEQCFTTQHYYAS